MWRRRRPGQEVIMAQGHGPHMQNAPDSAVTNVTTALLGLRSVPVPAQSLLCKLGFGPQLP